MNIHHWSFKVAVVAVIVIAVTYIGGLVYDKHEKFV